MGFGRVGMQRTARLTSIPHCDVMLELICAGALLVRQGNVFFFQIWTSEDMDCVCGTRRWTPFIRGVGFIFARCPSTKLRDQLLDLFKHTRRVLSVHLFFPSLSRRSRSPPRNSISHQFTLELLLSLVRKTQRAWLIFICCVFAFPLSLHPLCHFTPFVLFLPWDIILLGPTHSFRPILTSIPIPVLQPPRVSLFHLSPHSSLITCATRL